MTNRLSFKLQIWIAQLLIFNFETQAIDSRENAANESGTYSKHMTSVSLKSTPTPTVGLTSVPETKAIDSRGNAANESGTYSKHMTSVSLKSTPTPTVGLTSIPEIKRGKWIRLDGYEYYVSEKGVSKPKNESEQYCNEQNGTLALVKTDKIQKFIASLVASSPGGPPFAFYIGLHDVFSNLTFEWSDGERLTTKFWDTSEPNGNGTEPCVVMGHIYNHTPKLLWLNVVCETGTSGSKGFVCQRLYYNTTSPNVTTTAASPLIISTSLLRKEESTAPTSRVSDFLTHGENNTTSPGATISLTSPLYINTTLMREEKPVAPTSHASNFSTRSGNASQLPTRVWAQDPTSSAYQSRAIFTEASDSITIIIVSSTVGTFTFLVLSCLTLLGGRYLIDRRNERQMIATFKNGLTESRKKVNTEEIEMTDITKLRDQQCIATHDKSAVTSDLEISPAMIQSNQTSRPNRDSTYVEMASAATARKSSSNKKTTDLLQSKNCKPIMNSVPVTTANLSQASIKYSAESKNKITEESLLPPQDYEQLVFKVQTEAKDSSKTNKQSSTVILTPRSFGNKRLSMLFEKEPGPCERKPEKMIDASGSTNIAASSEHYESMEFKPKLAEDMSLNKPHPDFTDAILPFPAKEDMYSRISKKKYTDRVKLPETSSVTNKVTQKAFSTGLMQPCAESTYSEMTKNKHQDADASANAELPLPPPPPPRSKHKSHPLSIELAINTRVPSNADDHSITVNANVSVLKEDRVGAEEEFSVIEAKTPGREKMLPPAPSRPTIEMESDYAEIL